MARATTLQKVLLPLIATAACLGIAELLLRVLIPPPRALGQLSYETTTGEVVADHAAAAARGFVVEVDAGVRPRWRTMFAPGLSFYLRYSDAAVLQRDWFDREGRVLVRINRFGLREREEIAPEKPPGQKRIVCIGDSFTFGWGIPEELGWVRLLENDLRQGGADVRTVNCGAAGALCVDEYWWGLKHRFGAFQPDAVVVTLCLNDLIPSSGLYVQGPSPATGIRFVDLLLGAMGRNPLELDPAIDWVGILKTLPAEGSGELYGPDRPFDAMWSRGVPQASLRSMKAWCKERKIALLVTLWPFLQGLGPGRSYPFASLHAEVAADCASAGIPFLDLLPALRDHRAEDLWVTPADMHANPTAQRLVAPHLLQFVRKHVPW